MCGIAGFSCFHRNHKEDAGKWYSVLQKMNQSQKHRGPDDDGVYLSAHTGFGHTRLSILDPNGGHQPMTRQLGDHRATIVYNGEIYNMPAMRQSLLTQGAHFATCCDTEVLLLEYLLHGISFIRQLNGIFAFAIWDESLERLYLVRDRLGVKPLFFTKQKDTLVFASKISALFAYPGVEAIADKDSLCEIFALGPAKTYGKGVFRNIREVLPGHYLEFRGTAVCDNPYWKLQSKEHEDDWSHTVEKTRFLITDAVKMQMLSDVPICTFLSGGVDSSLVTAICSAELQKQSKILDTYSFDFTDNHLHFKANRFQPSEDRPWVDKMISYSHTKHHYLECSNSSLYDYLFKAVDARDLPCMADVEASMLFFCEQVSEHHKVTLTGECADEIFGGYPWFHAKTCFDAAIFPWSMDFTPRTMLLKNEILAELPLFEYAKKAYDATVAETPKLCGESAEEKRRREISYLNIKWFMQTLLDRMDRTAMYTGLEARVPFADHRIVEYLWNVPWSMKCKDGIVKGLLRKAAEGLLPDEVLYRKKSPYPKTYDPAYERLLKNQMCELIHDVNAPICTFIDKKKLLTFMETPGDYGKPFYGQLMAGPQLLAYLIQVNYWLTKYKVNIVFS